jgi:hypothetical protein
MQDVLAQKLAVLNERKQSVDGDMQSWVDDVNGLFKTAGEWLASEMQEGALQLIEQGVQVRESNAESYPMRQLAIQLDAGPLLLLIPRGRNVVGAVLKHGGQISNARGRVDLVNFEDRRAVGFFRGPDGKWFIPTPQAREVWAELDRDRFRAAMASLL